MNPDVLKTLGTIASESSEIAGVRPVNCAAFSPDSKALLTAGECGSIWWMWKTPINDLSTNERI